MRKLVLGGVVAAIVGAALAVIGALVSYWWTASDTIKIGTFSVGEPSAEQAVILTGTDWAGLLLPAAIVGALAGVLLATVGLVVFRKLQRPKG